MDLISILPTPCNMQRWEDDQSRGNDFTYRTERYLQQREEQRVNKSPSTTITTWKNLKYQKQMFEDDQEEIDRVLSTIDSIHGTFNRSLLISHNQVYSSLYGDDDVSRGLMKTFCQRQDYYMHYNRSSNDNDGSNTQELSDSFGNFLDTDSDSIYSDDEDEKENENEKKNSCDSGYGSVIPSRQLSRESLLNVVTEITNVN